MKRPPQAIGVRVKEEDAADSGRDEIHAEGTLRKVVVIELPDSEDRDVGRPDTYVDIRNCDSRSVDYNGNAACGSTDIPGAKEKSVFGDAQLQGKRNVGGGEKDPTGDSLIAGRKRSRFGGGLFSAFRGICRERNVHTEPPCVLELHDSNDQPSDRALSAAENLALQTRRDYPGLCRDRASC